MFTHFFIELPADEHGNVMQPRAVIEARLVNRRGQEVLYPVAPQYFVTNWSSGLPRSNWGGWARTKGPARMLRIDEHEAIVASLSEKARADAKSSLVRLRNDSTLPLRLVDNMMMSLHELAKSHPSALREAIMKVRDHGYEISPINAEILHDRLLIDWEGQVPIFARDVIESAAQGDGVEFRLVNPIAPA